MSFSWDTPEPHPSRLGTVPGHGRVGRAMSNVHVYSNSAYNSPSLARNADKHSRDVLSPSSISMYGCIVDDAARITVSHVFWNKTDFPITHAIYVFPLPSECTVTHFSCRIGRDRILTARARPKDEAREAFDKAAEEYNTAALLDQNTPETFSASLGKFPKDTRLETELTYIVLLNYDLVLGKNIMTLSIPTAITGQYGNAPKDIASVLPSDVSERFSLQLEITKAEEIIGIKSETHEITWDRLPYKPRVSTWEELSAHYCGPDVTNALVKLKSEANYSRKDFVLTIETRHLRSADNPHVCVESHPYLENQKALKITIPSSVAIDMARISDVGEVIFAVDRSGSMHDKIDTVRDSLRLFLDGIPIGRTFNIWSFGSSTEMLWEKSQPYDQERLQVALDYVEQRIQADMGGTELSSTLRGLLPFRDAHYPSDVIILTDGEAWQLEQTLAFIRNARDTSHGNLRFFSLGIGAHVSHALLRGIASLGGGYSEVLPMASLGGWKTRVFTTLKAALTCHDIDFKIEINGDDSLHRYLRSPIGPENFNLFQENRIYLLSKPDCPTDQVSSITLKILKAPGDRILTTISPIILEKTDTTIHTLAAGAILHDLEYHKIRAAWDEMREITQSQAKDFACRFSIVSKWTSLYLQQESLDLDSQEQVSCFLIRTSNDVGDIDLFRQRGAMPVDKEYRCSTHPTPISRSLRILSSILTLGHRPGEQEPVYTATGADLLTGRAYDFPDIGAVGYSVNLDACMGVYRIPKLGSNNHPQVPASNYRSVLVSPQYDCPPTPKRPRRTLRKRFITNLLAYQNFDGSIGVDVCSIRDPLFAKAAKGIEQYVLRNCHTVSSPANLVACTVVGVALLERDFRNDEALWTTMRTKAMKYVETQLSDKPKAFELLNLAKLWLSGEQPPLSNIGVDSGSQETEPTADSHSPERRKLEVAPMD